MSIKKTKKASIVVVLCGLVLLTMLAQGENVGARGLQTHGSLSITAHAQYGPDTCKQGYVWREAIPSDHVCVTPDQRSRVAADNTAAGSRRNPTGAYGSDTCIQGFVWREAFPNDHVCVTPDQRSQVAADNSQAQNRVAQ